jgi:hypothetical protein
MDKLTELYFQRVRSSLSLDDVTKELTWLTSHNWSIESIFFSINYAAKYYPDELRVSLKETLDSHEDELLCYFQIAQAKRAAKTAKESEATYDSSNSVKGRNTPRWFGKSFDKHLFE